MDGEQLEELVLPPGYRFRPTNLELIVDYLKNKILGRQLPSNIIPTFDCFSCNPDQLPLDRYNCGDSNEWSDQHKYGELNEWYFFSNGRKGDIRTEDGYFYVSSHEEVYEGTELVGFVRTLEFHYGIPPGGIKSEWIVEEFSVNPKLIQGKEDGSLVACKIICNKPRTQKAFARRYY